MSGNPTCATCRYFRPIWTDVNNHYGWADGECRRYPPIESNTGDPDAEWRHPLVSTDDGWCGEHEPIMEERRDAHP